MTKMQFWGWTPDGHTGARTGTLVPPSWTVAPSWLPGAGVRVTAQVVAAAIAKSSTTAAAAMSERLIVTIEHDQPAAVAPG
jgi:hypothetical protein